LPGEAKPFVERAAAALLGAATLGALALLVLSSNRGLELADEASWVLCAANPWASPAFGVFYGYLLHPVWLVCGEGVAGLRIAGYLLLSAAGLVFALSLARALPALGATRPSGARFWLLLFSIWAGTLTFYSCGSRSPSYNWVLVAGSLVAASGWLRLESFTKPGAMPLGPWLLLGTGLFMVGMGKWIVLPGYLVLFTTLLFLRNSPQGMIRDAGVWAVVTVSLIAVTALGIGQEGIRTTLDSGWALASSGSQNKTLLFLYASGILKFAWQILRALLWVAGLVGILWLVGRWRLGRAPSFSALEAAAFLAGAGLAFARGHGWGGGDTFAKGIMVTTVWLLGVFFAARPHLKQTGHPSPPPPADANARRSLLLLCLLPWLSGFGTATGITDFMAHSLVFLVAAGWIWLGRAEARGLPAFVLIAAVLGLGLIHASRAATSNWNNFRLGSVWAPMETVTVGPERGRLKLPARTVRCLEDIHRHLAEKGFSAGDPLIGVSDLTGLVYLLGGVSPGVCWYLGWNLPDVTACAKFALGGLDDATLRRSWLLLRVWETAPLRPEDFWPVRPGLAARDTASAELRWPHPEEMGLGITTPVRLYPPTSP